jgi:ATP-dependent Clp protease ATP-binding subunit ClpA
MARGFCATDYGKEGAHAVLSYQVSDKPNRKVANETVCDDMGQLAATNAISKLVGRGPEVKRMQQRLLAETPKLAIIGPPGNGKTQFVNEIAIAFAQEEPISGRGFPFMTRLLSLKLDRLKTGEAEKKGWASETLDAAKIEIENAGQLKGKHGQGVQFVIVVGT